MHGYLRDVHRSAHTVRKSHHDPVAVFPSAVRVLWWRATADEPLPIPTTASIADQPGRC